MKKTAFIYIVIAGLLWGSSGIFVNFLATFGFSSLQLTFLRSAVSFLVMLLYVLFCDKKQIKVKPKNLLLFFGSGISFFGTASFYYIALQKTSIATAAVLMYTAPVFVMIYSVAFFGEQLNAKKSTAVLCMLCGCFLVSGVIGGLKFDLFGIICSFLSGISYSAYIIFTKIAMRKKINPLQANVYCFFFATVIGFFICSVKGIPACFLKNAAATIPLILGLGVFTCTMPYFLYTLSLKTLPAGTASAMAIVEPMAATIYSVVLFKEKLSISMLCGIALILGAVLLLEKSEDNKNFKNEKRGVSI